MSDKLGTKARLSRRTVLGGLATVAASAISWDSYAAGDGGGLGTAEKPVAIRMIANDAFSKLWQDKLVPEFNKHYPHIQVTIDGVPYAQQLTKTLLDLTGASPSYDAICTDDPWTPALANAGTLLDIKKVGAAWTAPDFDWDDFYKAPLAASEWKGVQYGVPIRSNMLLMFYNRRHYRKAGLPDPTPALTWPQFMAQAPKLVQDLDGSGKVNAWAIGTYFGRDQLTPTIWQALLNASGGKLLDAKNKAAFNNKVGVETLQTFVDLLKYAPPGAKSYIFNEELQAFRQNQLATMFMWGSVFRGTAIDPKSTRLTAADVGIQVMPVGSKMAGTHRGIWCGVVSKRTKYPAAAWRFVQWISSKQGEQFASNVIGSFPARKSTIKGKPPEPWLQPVFDALGQAYEVAEKGEMWRPRLAKSDAVQQVLADEVALATSGDHTPAEALKRAEERINKMRLS